MFILDSTVYLVLHARIILFCYPFHSFAYWTEFFIITLQS